MEPINMMQIVEAIIAVMFGIIVRYIVPWIKGKTNEQQQENLRAIFQMIVEAAEQMFKGEGRGQEKFDYVKAELEKRGLEIDKNLIESTVLNLKNTLLAPLAPLAVVVEDEK